MTRKIFVGREKELEKLERIYSEDGLKTCVIFGRRQIGKSTLIREFCKGKRALILQSSDSSSYENKIRMRMDISNFLGKDIPEYDNYTEILANIRDICEEEKTVVVFDEYPYALKTAPEFASILQRFIDIDVAETETMVILCGSSMSVMCDEIESMDRPLYGRFVNRIEVKELSLKECVEFHANMSYPDIIRLYLTVGGIPKYHRIMKEPTYKACITEHFLSEWSELGNEAVNMITNELPANIYTAIVACIANGSTSQYEIADKVHCERPNCKMYLDRLERINIVRRINPMLDAPKRPIYRIHDDFVAFHYIVLERNATLIEGPLNPSEKYEELENDINAFLGHRFEELCGKYLETHRSIISRGKWWRKDMEVDIVARSKENDAISIIMCDCKFTKKGMGMAEYNDFRRTVDAVGCDNVKIVLFSVGGFDTKLKEFAEDRDITLIGLEDLFL